MTTLGTPQTAPRLLKEPAARRYLGHMSHGQFWQLRQEKRIRTIKIGRSVFFDVSDLDLFVDSIRQESA
jgi:hypothetical protein